MVFSQPVAASFFYWWCCSNFILLVPSKTPCIFRSSHSHCFVLRLVGDPPIISCHVILGVTKGWGSGAVTVATGTAVLPCIMLSFHFQHPHDCDTVQPNQLGFEWYLGTKLVRVGKERDWLIIVCFYLQIQYLSVEFLDGATSCGSMNPNLFSISFLVCSEMGKGFIPSLWNQINKSHPFQQQMQLGAFPFDWVSLSCILWVGVTF